MASSRDFESVLNASMSAPAPTRAGLVGTTRPSVLILSGGSQHGAFGAGFFAGMPQIPEYKLVTAVSTGALQSTFLFLANQPVPSDRIYPAYFHDAAGTPHTNTGDLALAYSIEREGDLLDVGGFGQIGGVVRGSIADFAPLRRVLHGLLSPETLRAVGATYRADPHEGRRLLVGVTDVNDGAGYAIDLTELANRLVRGAQPYASVRDCYVDALIASSSVPLAASPVTLEARADDGTTTRHLYIDGGARFGVFWSQLGDVLAGTMDPEVTLIVNGALYGKPWLDKAGEPRTEWSSLTLGLRAVDILENQVYRFSVENVTRIASGNGTVKMAFISNQNLPGAVEPQDFVFDGKSCRDWTAVDNLAKPTEFHPRYMRCLLEYGRARGRVLAWNRPR
ncbi:patatin-like phospholipase family protein [Sphingomonas sp.]|uniref:patatin-like phospholipase family protein n=1 Tax=Sphingomonas sp. TaxID=28214 RepID=UPI0035BC5EC0